MLEVWNDDIWRAYENKCRKREEQTIYNTGNTYEGALDLRGHTDMAFKEITPLYKYERNGESLAIKKIIRLQDQMV